jgi:hypothetical protein
MTNRSNWKQEVDQAAVAFASGVHQAFRSSMLTATKILPIETQEGRLFILNAFMDRMVALSCACGADAVGNCDLETEEQIIKMVRAKFKLLRIAQIQLKPELVPTPPQDLQQ